MPRITGLIEGINQDVLAVWFESNMQVNGSSGMGTTLAFPFLAFQE